MNNGLCIVLSPVCERYGSQVDERTAYRQCEPTDPTLYRNQLMTTAISSLSTIPSVAPVPVVSVGPIVLPAPGRAIDLQMRVSAPVTGSELPILLLSHGHGRTSARNDSPRK